MKYSILLVLLFISALCFGQGAFYQLPQPFPNTTVRVCPVPSGGNPCPSPVTIFNDQGLTQSIANPRQTGADGNLGFWVAGGQYTIQLSNGLSFVISLGGSALSGLTPPALLKALSPSTAGNSIVTDNGDGTITIGGSGPFGVESPYGLALTPSAAGQTPPHSKSGIDPNGYLAQSVNGGAYQEYALQSALPVPGGALGQIQYNNSPSSPNFQGFANTVITTPFNWSQTGNAASFPALTGGSSGTVTLVAGIQGVDTSGSSNLGGPLGGYPVYINDGANSEAVYVTGGTYTNGAGGTIIFTPFFSHTAGAYTVQSASTGTQEAINVACGISTTVSNNTGCRIILPATAPSGVNIIPVYGTIYFHTNASYLDGYGAVLQCNLSIRGPCLQIGDLTNANDYAGNTIRGVSFQTPTAVATSDFAGSLIASAQRTASLSTITTSAAHNLRNNDRVTIQFTDQTDYWGDVPQITVTGGTTFTYTNSGFPTRSLLSQPGVVALSYEAVLDNSNSTHFYDTSYFYGGESGSFNNFFDFWDDEDAHVVNFNNNGIGMRHGTNWVSSFVYSMGANNLPLSSHQLAPVITWRDSTITNGGTCATVTNSNGLFIDNVVCQNVGPWQFKVSSVVGNAQGASIKNLYTEQICPNTANFSPWAQLGCVGFLAGSTGPLNFVQGALNGFLNGVQLNGSGATTYCYYVFVHDTTNSKYTAPMLVSCFKQSSTQTNVVQWPRVAIGSDTIVYDLLRVPAPSGTPFVAAGGFVGPYANGCTGGAPGTCGSVVTSQAQTSGFIQSFSDNTANNTTSYSFAAVFNLTASPDFWPGVVVSTNSILNDDIEQFVTGIAFNFGGSAAVVDTSQVSQFCGVSNSGGGASVSGGVTNCLGSLSSTGQPFAAAQILDDLVSGGTVTTFNKGRLNFGGGQYIVQGHQVLTFVDAGLNTKSTTGYRPVANAGDVWLGYDEPFSSNTVLSNNAILAMGAPGGTEIFCNAVPNTSAGSFASNWCEQITSALTTFKVNVSIPSNTLAVGGGTAMTGTGAGGTMASTSMQASTAVNFGGTLGAQTVLASTGATSEVHVGISIVQTLAGASCTVASNTVTPTLSWTGPVGGVQTLALTALSISGNGTLGSFQNDPVDIAVLTGTSISYTTASTLASTGCSPAPQYTVYAKVLQ